MIEDIIGRNVDLPVGDIHEIILSEKEQFVIKKLNINESLIYNAKAILAASQKKYGIHYLKVLKIKIEFNVLLFIFRYLESAICYLKAENWQEAHQIIMNHLLADFILQKGYYFENICFFLLIFISILDGKLTLKHLLSLLINGSKVDGSVHSTMQDSLTMLEYLKLSEKLIKMPTEKIIAYVVSLCERVTYFTEKTAVERYY